MRFLFRVAVPITRPIIGSFVVISFLGAWNQYVWPRFATDQDAWQTVQVSLRNIANDRVDQLNIGFAAADPGRPAAGRPAHCLPTSDHPWPHRRCGQGMNRA